jgi:SPRY domain
MGVPGNANPLLLRTVTAAATGISRSLRFSAGDSAHLSRAPGSTGNRRTFTFSCWMKRGKFGSVVSLIGVGTDSLNLDAFDLQDESLRYTRSTSGSFLTLKTTAVFRDPSAWYHVVLAVDTTQSTAANRVRIYVNGTEQTAFSSSSYPSQNEDTFFNTTNTHTLGRRNSSQSDYFDGYIADAYLIDGQQVDPTSFGEFDSTTGAWNPKSYSGSYGSQGWHLEFADNSAATATTLGKDTSGNGNNWTPNNLSVTAGAGNDSLVDTPTNSGTDTASGGVVTGNYCVWNGASIGADATLSNGNLDISYGSSGTRNGTMGTFGMSSGKWYWEVTITASSTTNTNAVIGISNKSSASEISNYPGFSANGWGYYGGDGKNYNNGVDTGSGATYGANDVIGVAFDADAGTLVFYKNGTSQGTAYSGLAAGTYFPGIGDGGSTSTFSASANFGQRPFTYQTAGTNRPASTYKALCTANLPAPSVTKPSTVMDVKLYTGNGSTQSITGLGFNPDLVWTKTRSQANNNFLFDSVRGVGNWLISDLTNAETYSANTLTSFNSDGFTTGSNNDTNASGRTFVAWCWDAGTSTVTNTQGSITSSVRANATAGFSIVTYTGNGTNNVTVGHGLGVAPRFLIGMDRTGGNWQVWGANMNNGSFDCIMNLNTTDALATGITTRFRAASSTTFTIGTDGDINANGNTYVTYCFAPVSGYSSFGSYTGNGSTDGPFVFCGFRPRWLVIKCSNAAGNGWFIQDTARDTYNPCPSSLVANESSAEQDYKSAFPNDMLSNGFKLRTSNGVWNGSGNTYIYAAFAESPFNYSRAR